jgi:S-adenosylmethionine decarboxylase
VRQEHSAQFEVLPGVRREAQLSDAAMTEGIEWIVDARGCDPARLADRPTLTALFAEIVRDLELRVVGEPLWHVFPGEGGITGLCLLAESHLTVHTFPEHGSMCLNLFCCRARPEWNFEARLQEMLGAMEVDVRRLERQYAAEGASLLPPPASR